MHKEFGTTVCSLFNFLHITFYRKMHYASYDVDMCNIISNSSNIDFIDSDNHIHQD